MRLITRRRTPSLYEQAVRDAARQRRARRLRRTVHHGGPALAVLGLALVAVTLSAGQLRSVPSVAALAPERLHISGEERAAGLRFDEAVSPSQRGMVAAAMAAARPEARRLIAEVDGLVDVGLHDSDEHAGLVADEGGDRLAMTLDRKIFDRVTTPERDAVVLHELGHVVHRALLSERVIGDLDEGIPRRGCPQGSGTGECAPEAERFADTFAKWATRGEGPVLTGYLVAVPEDLEAWGAPLADIAGRLP